MGRNALTLALELNAPIDPNDHFAYGWRYVTKVAKNGSEKTLQVPLTLEDILHPQEEDFQIHSTAHFEDTAYLYGAFKIALHDTSGSKVLSCCRVAWDREGEFAHGPDSALIFNVQREKNWSTFNCVKEKTKPALIIEVTSPCTRSTDLVDKVRDYAQQGVPHYVIADAKETEVSRKVSLIDYHLSPTGGSYYSLPVDKGRVWLKEVKLWLSVEDGQLRCIDAKGKRIGTAVEEHRAREEAEKRAADAEARIKELEERLRHAPGAKGRNETVGK